MSEFYGYQPTAAAFVRPRREYFTKRQTLLVAAGTVVAAALGVGGVFGVQDVIATHLSTPAAVQQQLPGAGGTTFGFGSSGSGASGSSGSSGSGFGSSGSGSGSGFGSGSGLGSSGGSLGQDGSGSSSQAGSAAGTAASSAESRGIVLIDTELGYQDAEAAGTGMVLTSNGEVLTNNHVVEGSTAIKVEVVSTGKSYTAKVVGTDATDDVAVLQLQGASGLTTAKFDTSGAVRSGDAVTGVGNAEGGGQLLAAPGQVTGLDQSITTEAEASAASESLSGLIETNASIEPGDSGGPLYDADGEIVGMDTAASTSGTPDGYAIPITSALDLAGHIVSGDTGDGIQQGYPAFLGVELGQTDASGSGSGAGSEGFGSSGFGAGGLGSDDGSGSEGAGSGDGTDSGAADTAGAQIAGVVSGGPAASAGLEAGDVVTAVGGTAIGSSSELSAALQQQRPGDRVSITWADTTGASHTATVTLTEGPAA
ncbi:MAG TPA: trypsin-like peptidase domain-containing protein [Gryllotalpicola sp.]